MADKILELLEDLTDSPDCHDIKKVACQVREISVADFLGKRTDEIQAVLSNEKLQ